MNLIPMGEYYIWHCDWCDSTNHSHWSSMNRDSLTCAACHQRAETALPGPTGVCRNPATVESHAGLLFMGS